MSRGILALCFLCIGVFSLGNTSCDPASVTTASSETLPMLHPWGTLVPLLQGEAVIPLAASAEVRFLRMGNQSFEPTRAILEESVNGTWRALGEGDAVFRREAPQTLGLFQRLQSVTWRVEARFLQAGRTLRLRLRKEAPAGTRSFFNHIIVVNPVVVLPEPAALELREVGQFGAALHATLRDRIFDIRDVTQERESLTDPLLSSLSDPHAVEPTWSDLRERAYPLDFQKILLSGMHDGAPGFAFQNGQWFVTVPSRELGGSHREDRWFAPALKIGRTLYTPAPLSAQTKFVYDEQTRRILPQLEVLWQVAGRRIHQRLSSQMVEGMPQIVSHFHITGPLGEGRGSVKLVLGIGRRPSVHFWGNIPYQGRPSLSYLTFTPRYHGQGRQTIVDSAGEVVLRSSRMVQLTHSGVAESVVEIPLLLAGDSASEVDFSVSTPQVLRAAGPTENAPTLNDYNLAQQAFETLWRQELTRGARVRLPSTEWMNRIDSWLYQSLAMTRVDNRLNYGAYYYDMYFGVEEGWPVVALALWGQGAEAQREAELMLSAENLDRHNHHHQYRNGLSSWYALEVARVTHDRNWLARIIPALQSNAQWTTDARRQGDRTDATRGLLPRHAYGGDIATPAYSLYANATCWRGQVETAFALRQLGRETEAQTVLNESRAYRQRLTEVFNASLNRDTTPHFLPLALELAPRTPGGSILPVESAYPRLTADFLGNYWNLFAPLTLHVGLLDHRNPWLSSFWITDYLETHGGLWGGLPRFNAGLDAVYAVGYTHELLERARTDVRHRLKALTALQSYMLHAASHNGFAVPEVSSLFNMRFDRGRFEDVTRSAPWMFGVYDGSQYLQGEISVTEPLSAGAGEGLWLMRKALVDETRTQEGQPDGGLVFLSAVPSEWLAEGQVIELRDMPTAYGLASLRVVSRIRSHGTVQVQWRVAQAGSVPLRSVRLRLVAPDSRQPRWGGGMSDAQTIVLPLSSAGSSVTVRM